MHSNVIVALDTSDLEAAKALVARLADHVFAFKVGHALVLPFGLHCVDELQRAGAQRVFLDMKFHDIPNSVALGVYEAAKRGVWMMTLHASGGKAMMAAAVEAAADADPEIPPILLGVTVLTSIDAKTLSDQLGVSRPVEAQALILARHAVDAGLDGVVCSGQEVEALRRELGPDAILVAPGVKSPVGVAPDQARTADATETLAAGANYLVIGRAVTTADDPEMALGALGL